MYVCGYEKEFVSDSRYIVLRIEIMQKRYLGYSDNKHYKYCKHTSKIDQLIGVDFDPARIPMESVA